MAFANWLRPSIPLTVPFEQADRVSAQDNNTASNARTDFLIIIFILPFLIVTTLRLGKRRVKSYVSIFS
ncbi:MAG: hypothetical protein ABF932_02095 [Gluconobacter potus]|uniref:hypothetical protein n=1 Tax=Gluconobacter TaxID=441 RepID=UPI001884D913|nr:MULTISPECIES: hypothetical protein [Gluconobacter]MBF0863853.1 hypothetical protein [Gluconobacter sp. R71656]MBF0866660.1 hypothetical protein [Gluconobacter sp. R75628]MBF0872212.1 hypothetical protein [Gluconobacter sp. R75629]